MSVINVEKKYPCLIGTQMPDGGVISISLALEEPKTSKSNIEFCDDTGLYRVRIFLAECDRLIGIQTHSSVFPFMLDIPVGTEVSDAEIYTDQIRQILLNHIINAANVLFLYVRSGIKIFENNSLPNVPYSDKFINTIVNSIVSIYKLIPKEMINFA